MNYRMSLNAAVIVGAVLLGILPAPAQQPASADSSRWEDDIKKFEAADREHPPAPGGIVFVGSSSIRLWDLEKSFPDRPVINRGFGGSAMADVAAFADRIVVPYKPKTVVIYSGDNDLANGKSPAQVVGDFQAAVQKIQAALPETRIVVIAIKPSKARWNLAETMREANGWMRAVVDSDPHLAYADVHQAMLTADGKLREELFVADGLHLNAAGYELWTSIVGPLLDPPGAAPRP